MLRGKPVYLFISSYECCAEYFLNKTLEIHIAVAGEVDR
jgi:hypothetical protein